MDKMREEFEKWCKSIGFTLRISQSHGDYMLDYGAEQWSAWKAAHKAAVPDGYCVVPIEPTRDMLDAARDWSHGKYGTPIGSDAAIGCYKSMVQPKQKP